MTYIEVPKDKMDQKIQDIYKYMPTYVTVGGSMVRVIAQEPGGVVYYVK